MDILPCGEDNVCDCGLAHDGIKVEPRRLPRGPAIALLLCGSLQAGMRRE